MRIHTETKNEQVLEKVRLDKSHKTVLIYPNTYHIGMSSVGFQHIYSIINNHPEFYADRAFLNNEFALRSLELNKPLKNFEILFFSISYEMDYLNLIHILLKANIPVKAKDRDINYPLVVIGGACTFFNPEPIADFADIFILGEGEETLIKFLNIYSSKEYKNKNDFFAILNNISGFYLPNFFDFNSDKKNECPVFNNTKIIQQHINNISLFPAHSHIISSDTEFKDMLLFEISRGCPMKCKFCMVKSVYGTLRHQDKNIILSIAEKYKSYTNKIGLIAPTVTVYPDLLELCHNLLKIGYKISFSSLRLEHLNSSIIEILAKSGQKTITIAPEAGSEKLRNLIGKNIAAQQIFSAIETALNNGILNVKLYFMIGLPHESWEDIKEIVILIEKVRELFIKISSKKGKIGKIIISINPFIPKPFTEFQHHPQEDIKLLKDKYKYLKKNLCSFSNLELNLENLNETIFHALLSQGDRRLGDVILKRSQGYNLRKALLEVGIICCLHS